MPLNFSRRHWLGWCATTCLSGWLAPLAMAFANAPRRQRSCILLWMDGGPSTIDMWDLKPGHANGGSFSEIATRVPGIRISEHLPRLARHTDKMTIVRSMSTREGDHTRARFLLRSGYMPQGAIQFPAFGAALAHELTTADAAIPPFVSISPPAKGGVDLGGGFLGPRFNPLVLGQDETAKIDEALTMPNIHAPMEISESRAARRVASLANMNRRFMREHLGEVVESRHSATVAAHRLMRPEIAQAFDLTRESSAVRDAYGRTLFGQGCLLARRLVERNVPFVEVSLTGWDTHSDNFKEVAGLSHTVDVAFAGLLEDLATRGLLETTLVVWMGEFGRTPKINLQAGRDHWPNAFSTVLAGGGILGGQTYGRTSADGATVEERPVSVPDFLATICRAIGVDYTRQNNSNVDRPIPIVDRGGTPLRGVTA